MRRGLIVAAAVAGLALAACGEKTEVTVYKQGKYQGKPDNRPWDAEYKGDQVAWEKAIKARNNGQNEYVRIGAQ